MHEETWKKLKDARKKSGDSWNIFLLKCMDKKRV